MDTLDDRMKAAVNKQVRVELVERGMDQKDLADAMGTGRDTLNRYLMGHRSMNIRTFAKLAEALGVPASVLLARAEARLQTAVDLNMTNDEGFS